MVATGDLTDFGLDEEYADLRAARDASPVPIHRVPGNHDHLNGMVTGAMSRNGYALQTADPVGYERNICPRWYSYDLPGLGVATASLPAAFRARRQPADVPRHQRHPAGLRDVPQHTARGSRPQRVMLLHRPTTLPPPCQRTGTERVADGTGGTARVASHESRSRIVAGGARTPGSCRRPVELVLSGW
ncbi:MAG: hypothetical protein JWM19_6119 [Actinomycetia bacterium]|nr:hypothetical protein [Actinomycetes bacterium]